MNLKLILLSTNVFENNDYIDKYVELIEQNRNTKKEKFRTQLHHIIPKCYYKINKLQIDNSKENLVNLLYKDHILAHYYLSKCMLGTYRYHMFASLLYILGKYREELEEENFKIENLENYQESYEEYKIYNSEHQKGVGADLIQKR